MKTSIACTGMLSYEIEAFKYFKTAKNYKQDVNHMHHSSRARGTVLSPNQYVVDQKVAVELYYILIWILITFH